MKRVRPSEGEIDTTTDRVTTHRSPASMGRRAAKSLLLLLLAVSLPTAIVAAQEHDHSFEESEEPADEATGDSTGSGAEDTAAEEEPVVGFTGSATLGADLYDYSGTSPSFHPSRPSSLLRLVVATELRISDLFTLPIDLMLSSEETSVVTPLAGSPSIGQYMQNQLNRIGIAPRLGWAQLFLGSHTPSNTGLAFDGSQLFGGGIALTPGKFFTALSYGVAQRGVEVDTVAGIRGAYRQNAWVASVGYGEGGDSSPTVRLSLTRVQDDTTSIRRLTQTTMLEVPDSAGLPKLLPIVELHPLMPLASEGASASLGFGMPIVKGLSFSAEGAVSNYTRDQSAAAIEDEIPVLSGIMTQRISSRIDYALTGAISFSRPTYGITARALHYGPGFVTFGSPYTASDRQEITLSPRLSLLQGRLHLSGSIGARRNNLAGTKSERTSQLIGAASVAAVITERLSLDLSFNTMGVSSTRTTVDTLGLLGLRNNTQSIGVTPTYVISGEKGTHVISASFGYDTYESRESEATFDEETSTATIGGVYAMTLSRFSASINGAVTRQRTVGGELAIDVDIESATLALGYRLFDDKVRPTLSTTLTHSATGADNEQSRLSLGLGAVWSITSSTTFDLTASTDFHDYRRGTIEDGVTERLLRASLTQRW